MQQHRQVLEMFAEAADEAVLLVMNHLNSVIIVRGHLEPRHLLVLNIRHGVIIVHGLSCLGRLLHVLDRLPLRLLELHHQRLHLLHVADEVLVLDIEELDHV